MAKVIAFPAPNYFGDCPSCGRNDGYLNIYRDYWFFCRRHKARWFAGANVFPSWRGETEQVWQRNAHRLFGYREVEPRHRWRSPHNPQGQFGGDDVPP